MNVRKFGNPVCIETLTLANTDPVPMAFAEGYSALVTGTIDGQESPYSIILSSKIVTLYQAQVAKTRAGTN